MIRPTGRLMAAAIIAGCAASAGQVGIASADNVSVKHAIEYQDNHALKLSPQLKAVLKLRHPSAAEDRTAARLSRAFAVKADAAASTVAKTTASTRQGRAGQIAWEHSGRDLAALYRDVADEDLALADGNRSTAKRAAAAAVRDQQAVDRLDRLAERDLGLPKGD